MLTRIIGTGNGLRAQILRGSIGSAAAKAGYTGCQFLAGVILARLLGPDGLGVYALTMALVQLLAIGAQFGFPAFLVRSVSVAHAVNDASKVRALAAGAVEVVVAITTLLLIIVAILVWGFDVPLAHVPGTNLIAGLALVPLLALSATVSSLIRGLGHVVLSQFATDIVRPLLFLLMLLACIYSGSVVTSLSALILNGAALTVSLFILFVILRQNLPQSVPHITASKRYGEWVGGSLPFVLLAGTQVLNYQADVMLLGILTTAENVGFYRVALQFADGVGVALFAISITIAPQFARLQEMGAWRQVQKLLIYAHRAATAFMLPVGLVLIALSGPLIAFVYGEQYGPASDALRILVIGKIFYATVCFAGLALSMMGKPIVAAIISLVTLLLNVALNLILIPMYGIEGAAIATGVSEFIVNAIGLIYLTRVFSIDAFVFSRPTRDVLKIPEERA